MKFRASIHLTLEIQADATEKAVADVAAFVVAAGSTAAAGNENLEVVGSSISVEEERSVAPMGLASFGAGGDELQNLMLKAFRKILGDEDWKGDAGGSS